MRTTWEPWIKRVNGTEEPVLDQNGFPIATPDRHTAEEAARASTDSPVVVEAYLVKRSVEASFRGAGAGEEKK